MVPRGLVLIADPGLDESRLIDEALGNTVGEDGLIARGNYEVALADGYGEHYIYCKTPAPAEAQSSKDGEGISIGDIIQALRDASKEEFRDCLDELFFDGAWPNEDAMINGQLSETFKRDVAGLLFAAIHGVS